jgi:hypothetical protein
MPFWLNVLLKVPSYDSVYNNNGGWITSLRIKKNKTSMDPLDPVTDITGACLSKALSQALSCICQILSMSVFEMQGHRMNDFASAH